MKYETIKSILLTFLVCLSIGLTWALWTYQPAYEALESGKFVEEVEIGVKKEEAKIIKPDKIIYHTDGGHFGTSATTDVDKLMKEMGSWVFFDVKNYTEQAGGFKQAVHGNGKAEIVFPHEVPIEVFRNVLSFEEKKTPSFLFDRIVVDMKNLKRDRGIVYFANVRNQEVFISYISPAFLEQFSDDFYEKAKQYPPYFAFEPNEKRTIFLPEMETVMKQYKYLPKNLDSEDFKEALFRNPSLVQKSTVAIGEEYANDTSRMNIFTNEALLSFVNLGEEVDYLYGSGNLLKRSIDFINENGGWTDPYRFVYLGESDQKVTFRMYSMDGYPVFNMKGLSEITTIWGRNEIKKFTRPTFAMELPIEVTEIKRPSGKDALEFLKKKPEFKPELLENLVLGYKMERDAEARRLILLEPTWYYLYNNAWIEISMEELGGLKRGLE